MAGDYSGAGPGNRSRSIRFRILPDGFRGRASMNSIGLRLLEFREARLRERAQFRREQCIVAFPAIAPHDHRTDAFTPAGRRLADHADLSHAGCAPSTSSTSAG